jgi:hypothetical protein
MPLYFNELAGHVYDLVPDTDWLKRQGTQIHIVFNADGTMTEDDVEKTGIAPVHHAGTWRLNGHDLEFYDSAGECVNYWRLFSRNDPAGTIRVYMNAIDASGPSRFPRKFRVTSDPIARLKGTERPAETSMPLYFNEFAGHAYDLVPDTDWLKQQGTQIHIVFNPDGTMTEDNVEKTGILAVHQAGTWRVNGNDLEFYDPAGQCVNYWRLFSQNNPVGTIRVHMTAIDTSGPGRFSREFRVTSIAKAPAINSTVPSVDPPHPTLPPSTPN